MMRADRSSAEASAFSNSAMNRLPLRMCWDLSSRGPDSLQHNMLIGDARGENFEH